MGRTGPFIEVSPTQLSILHAGRPGPRCLSQRLYPDQIERLWQGAPAEASTVLSGLHNELGAVSSRPIVFFQSPTGVCGLFSCPTQVRDTTSAARMSLAEMTPFDIESNAWSVQPIERDRTGSLKRRHILVSADTDESLRRLRGFCDGAGLTGATFVPLEAALLCRAVDTAIAHSTSNEPLICVFFGQSKSLIVAAHQQRLLLVRQVDFGTDRLVEALATAIESTNPENAHDVADRLIFGFGLPKPGDTFEVDGQPFSTSDILPAIQPALQRLVVEVRQSIRFGLSEINRSPNILITGSGASVPRLDQAFGSELECPCFSDNSRAPDSNFDLAHASEAWERGLRVSLREREFGASAVRHSLRNALYAGSAAAVLIGTGATVLLSGQPATEPAIHPGIDVQSASLDLADPELASRRAAAVRATVRAVSETTGSRPDMGSVLRELCILTADAAILTDIEISGDTDTSSCTLRGYIQGESAETAERLRRLVDDLRNSPLIDTVRLESTQTSVLDHQTALYFSAVLEFSSAPAPVLQQTPSLANASAGRTD